MKISEFLSRAKQNLQKVSDTPLLDAELILSETLQKPREFLCARPEYLLSTPQKKQAGIMLQKRLLCRPMAQILGKKEFFGLEFAVDKHVLVPRPETEFLVEKAILYLQNGGTLIDMGTGSGCIAISVAKNSKLDAAYAIDISSDALRIAQKNAEKHEVSKIFFIHSDLFQDFSHSAHFSSPIVITANLPYVPNSERHHSTQHEPETAIYSGSDGLDHYRRFFSDLKNFSFDMCLFEFHPPQKEELEHILSQYFPKAKGEFFRDYAGLWRFGMISLEKE